MPNPYSGNYKVLVAIPLALVLLSCLFIPQIKLGVDFKGGTLATMQASSPVDADALKAALTGKGYTVSSVKSLPNPKGYEVEVEIERDDSLTRAEGLKSAFFDQIEQVSLLESDVQTTNASAEAVSKYASARLEIDKMSDEIFAIAHSPKKSSSITSTNELKQEVGVAYRQITDGYSSALSSTLSSMVNYESASFNEVSASLSAKFLEKAFMVVIYSTILVSVAVFIIFRTFVPSLAVLLGATCDVLIALGAMGLFGIPLTLASFAALIMLVGFSLDTDVLLTMRVIKRKEGQPRDRAYDAMKTGMTMSMALMLAFACLFILASVTHINTYYEISAVALIGLIGDQVATWLLNGVIVLWYLEHGGQTGEGQKSFLSSIFSN
jgi:preprotein translocase subunit SecF